MQELTLKQLILDNKMRLFHISYATKYMFKLARSSSRIKRLYIYSWLGEQRGARFDAGLVNPDGSARPAYDVVKRQLK